MTLAAYQDLFARMVFSPQLRRRVADEPDVALHGSDLTPLESRRLASIAAQEGMRVNAAIHRANRLAPLNQTVPFTLQLLGGRLLEVLERYWQENPSENPQLPAECARFSAFLRGMIDGRELAVPLLEEVLDFECACVELRFLATDRIDAAEALRVVSFSRDPVRLLDELSKGNAAPEDLMPGSFHLAIDCRSGEPVFRLLDAGAREVLRKQYGV